MKFTEGSVLASICRESFFEFVKEFWEVIVEEPPQFNWHVEYLCEEFQDIAMRVFHREKRLYDWLCNIPPGSTKSTIISQMAPAWTWTFMPHAQFICVSYSHIIALKDSLKTRDIVESKKYRDTFPGLVLRDDSNTKGMYVNNKKGFRLSAGVGGAITGMHGHFLLVDDPLNPEQSYSEAELKTVNRWMRTTLPSRRVPKHVAPILLIQQRLHQMDPSGEMIERYREKNRPLRHICLPGEITDDVKPVNLRKRYVNGLLDPVRLSREVLDEMEADLGAYGYAGQVLQTPVPSEGNMFEVDKIHIMNEAPKMKSMVRSWDKAGTEGAGKYSVGLLMGVDELKRYWILDVWRDRVNATKRERAIRATAEKDGVGVPALIEIEGGSGGKESGEFTVQNLAGFRIVTYHPTGDKVSRAYPLSSQVGGGNVYCLHRAWTNALIEEWRYFPSGKFSDQVDAGSGAFNFLSKGKIRVGGAW